MKALLAAAAAIGGVAFLLAKLRKGARSGPRIPSSDLNKDIDLARYRPTPDPILFLDGDLPDHPFKVGDGGIFCSVCLINTRLKSPADPVTIHEHACTVIRKDWKIVICRDGIRAEYYISLGSAHLKKGR